MRLDILLMLLFAALTLATYGLWAAKRLRRVRIALGVLSVVSLAAALVSHSMATYAGR